MGGFGSGRYGGRPTVEDGLSLDLPKLIRDELVRPSTICNGSLVWTRVNTGERVGSIGYNAHIGGEHGRVRLHYTSGWDGEKRDLDYWIELTTTPQPFGGRRWWFICPKTGQRVAKLHLPPGAFTFASRKAYRLSYRSQRQTRFDRALGQAQKIRTNLGGSPSLIDPFPDKPKGMRWRTYEHLQARADMYEEIADQHLAILLGRLMHL